MQLTVHGFENGAPIPPQYAFCAPASQGIVSLAKNRNPALSWSDVPEATQSFALIFHDRDVPSKPDDVNQEDRLVPADLPRVDFFHWVLIDMPASLRAIAEAVDADGVAARGKAPGKTELGVRGINDYTNWFKGDENMEGIYAGYDGPCPPWNDAIVHNYFFTLYALDIESLSLSGNFTGQDARQAMQGHILAEATWHGTYTVTPSLLKK
ncbi:PEBP family protein [Chloroherpeton thalassium ATCC 35110]|uniref:PEBP family protein n=1 Tax=Chloroherpeton thalassium (strain ATCC 35110 / GB-78) TaxID=517418 RepID=B3QV57_CHLT3|nr:YbhB/YbcL family Raf kinase inhibitor-like protein [Chloroherpeton thalassium]ACF13011.1 PEBP family protein [Chloroherpeton thalassium ATCC 35110]